MVASVVFLAAVIGRASVPIVARDAFPAGTRGVRATLHAIAIGAVVAVSVPRASAGSRVAKHHSPVSLAAVIDGRASVEFLDEGRSPTSDHCHP